ncbi:DUF3320 domain-containing protein [Microbacterium sp. WCS2018Hpa-9]|uniref:DUF3320 domain-containing protein n=1 Tax=Microbacterium sp. WCS2018Hpa-9 TaxID=3073635 RepID=UPI00288BB1E8|nr:DUF3320 domain-containing protein [Microbacterium sp. WCS2018Hpa-9]
MSDFSPAAYIEQALTAGARALGPFVTRRLSEVAPEVSDWTQILAAKDRQAGRRVDRYNPRDLSLQLRVLTERLGTLGFPFTDLIDRQASNCASELRDVRNKWAHSEEFTVAQTFRALDSTEILLRAIAADEDADAIGLLKSEVLTALNTSTESTHQEPNEPTASPATPEAFESPTLIDESGSAASLAASVLSPLSFAVARTGISVVPQLTVAYRGPELRGASVEVEVDCQLGALGDPRVLIVDLDGEHDTILRNVDLRLDPGRMLAIESPMPGTVTATLRDANGDEIASQRSDVQLLAANQWIAKPMPLSLELLAAFIQPQSSAISALLVEASTLLGNRTGSSALDGYQQGDPDRIDSMVEAIYDAARARDIRYAEPPASWGLTGQKVRTPTEVLEGRLGTCMDTTLTLAAALEEVGINSTLWLLEGHIFLGYWREWSSLDAPAQAEASEAINLVGLGKIGLVETTKMTGGAESAPFGVARRQPFTDGNVDPTRVIGVTDVLQARQAAIYPLPSRSLGTNGEVTVHEYRAAAAPDPLQYNPSATDLAGDDARRLPARVSSWKNSLLDLSLRNRLINYTPSAGHSIAVPQPALAAFEDLINSGSAITLLPSDRIPDVDKTRGVQFGRDLPEAARSDMLMSRKSAYVDITEGAYTSRLRALAYKARTIAEETGANNLYVAFGMLRWRFNDRDLRSPLILVPVTLEPAGRGSVFRIRVDETGESTPNYCLLEKLRVTHGIRIPGLENPAKDEAGINLAAAFAAARQGLAEARLPFTVEDSADLSILQFGKYRLWKDLDESWETFTSNPLVKHLVHTPTAAFEDPSPSPTSVDLDALGTSLPVPADSSQLDAVSEAVADRTFVLEGPPGTGKSQTITNLLAHAIVNGKRVLFVAEKRAALDVVKQRLDAVGLGPFSLDLHDKGARPNAVRAQLKEALETSARPDGAALSAQNENAVSSRSTLRRYADRLHESNTAGMSFYTSRDRLLAFEPDAPTLDIPTAFVSTSSTTQIDFVRTTLRRLPDTADLVRPAELNGWGFVDVTSHDPSDIGALHRAAMDFDQAIGDVFVTTGESPALSHSTSPEFIERWSQLAGAPRFSLESLDQLLPRVRSGELSALQQHLRTLTAASPQWTNTVSLDALSANPAPGAVHIAAQAADASGFFGRRKRQRSALEMFGDSLLVPLKSVSPKSIAQLTGQVEATAASAAALRNGLLSLPVSVVSAGWNPFDATDAARAASQLDWLVWLSGALELRPHDLDATILRETYRTSPADPALSGALAKLGTAWRSLEVMASPKVGAGVLKSWASPRAVVDAWGATRGSRALDTSTPTSLQRWVAFARALEPLRSYGLSDAHAALISGRVLADDASIAFDKGVAASSLVEREHAQGLEMFDPQAHSRSVERFTSSTAAIRAELPRWIPAEILGRRKIDAAYSGGRLGELKRQIGRQRGGLSVRGLMDGYADLITQITPCVLASPESVSRFFPATGDLFDIVVFDEASQIRVPDAIGAMGRSNSVVVVGDSKQMPPTSFADVVTDSDEVVTTDSTAIADEESILSECVQAQVPRRWLSWHYRSQDEALIAFSNHKYYDGRLASFPAPWPTRSSSRPSVSDHGVSLVRVDGHFNRSGRGRDLRTNIVEARAIVGDIARRFAASDTPPSLGVVTFNAQQRSLIESLLRDESDDRIAAALDQRDGLFVKNLENVQGDERDTILFSVAFSSNERGDLPLNFGPLSRAGGERRLNVAITRARREVILFASFDPSDLRAEQTSSVGIKHLRSYLQLAADGIDENADEVDRSGFVDRHREEIATALRDRGHVLQTDIGLSDFRVDIAVAATDDPEQPALAILLDGPTWRERRTVTDRDALPTDVLKGLMNWPGVERVWLPEWLQQRERTLDRIDSAVREATSAAHRAAEEAVAKTPSPDVEGLAAVASVASETSAPDEPGSRAAVSEPGLLAQSAPAPVVADLQHPRIRDFSEWSSRTAGGIAVLDALPSPAAAQRVRDLVHEVITHEGPIHRMRLVKLVAGAFGLSKVHASRAEAILRCVPSEFVRSNDRAVLWPRDVDPRTWRDVRRPVEGSARPLEHVPLAEIANAMAVVAALSGGMTDEEIKRESLGLFGGKRVTSGIGDRLSEALDTGLSTGRLERRSEGLIMAGS